MGSQWGSAPVKTRWGSMYSSDSGWRSGSVSSVSSQSSWSSGTSWDDVASEQAQENIKLSSQEEDMQFRDWSRKGSRHGDVFKRFNVKKLKFMSGWFFV